MGLSQLIRAGAYEKAVNILNTRHIGVFGVQACLSAVAEQHLRAQSDG